MRSTRSLVAETMIEAHARRLYLLMKAGEIANQEIKEVIAQLQELAGRLECQ